jgi:hypothetical protein
MILEVTIGVLVSAVKRISSAVQIPNIKLATVLVDDSGIWAAHHRSCPQII